MATVVVHIHGPSAVGPRVEVEAHDVEVVWRLKVRLHAATGVPPFRQALFATSGRELENGARLRDCGLREGGERRAVLKDRDEGRAEERRRGKRKRRARLVRGRKFRDLVEAGHCFAGGRGLRQAAAGLPCTFQLFAVTRDFQPLACKDAAVFEVLVDRADGSLQPSDVPVTFSQAPDLSIVASWVPPAAGIYRVHVRLGDRAICNSPAAVEVVDPGDSGARLRELALDSRWNVEAARVLAEWAACEERQAELRDHFGVSTIFHLLGAEPAAELRPLVATALSSLLLKDSMKQLVAQEGGVRGMLQLAELCEHPVVSRFVCRCFAMLGQLAASEAAARSPQAERQLQALDGAFFCRLEGLLAQVEDVETVRNIARAVSLFCSSAAHVQALVSAGLFPHLVGLFEGTGTDGSARRYALSALAHLSAAAPAVRERLFTPARVQALAATVAPHASADLAADGVRALANLCEAPAHARLLLEAHAPAVRHVLLAMSGTDTLARWEMDACRALLPGGQQQKADFAAQFAQFYTASDTFNFHAVRLLGNLLNHDKESALFRQVAEVGAIRSLVQFIGSVNLQLQTVACRVIAKLAVYEECRRQLVALGGLSALCAALNTCSAGAVEEIVAALAQMPLDVKGALVNMIGEAGIRKLIALLKQSANKALQKDTAILLASIAGNDTTKVVREGGAAFLRSLIELVRKGAVHVQTDIAPEEVQMESVVGRGISGVVWRATWRGGPVAAKVFDEESLAFSNDEFQSEVALMSVLRHENIAHCMGSCMQAGSLFIVSELFQRGSLAAVVEDASTPLPVPLAVHLALGAARGMKYLHTLGIIHRDLKCGNVLVTDAWLAKVADFGLSRVSDKTMTRGVGTPIYTAPEALAGSAYTLKADVYSFAFVLWELVTRQVPFLDLAPFEAVRRASDEGLRPDIPAKCVFEHLIRRCWDAEPAARPDFAEIVDVLEEIQRVVGPPSAAADDEADEADEQLYNYEKASFITHRTLRGSSATATTAAAAAAAAAAAEESAAAAEAPRERREAPRERRGGSRIKGDRKDRKKALRKSASAAASSTASAASPLPVAPAAAEVAAPASPAPASPAPASPAPSHAGASAAAGVAGTWQAPVREDSPSGLRQTTPNLRSQVLDSRPKLASSQRLSTTFPCAACGEAVAANASMVKTLGKVFHAQCFCCAVCKRNLAGVKWCTKDGQLYCQEDFDRQFLPRCCRCKQAITTAYVNALEQSWHKDCFTCVRCNGPVGQYYCVLGGEPCCENCS